MSTSLDRTFDDKPSDPTDRAAADNFTNHRAGYSNTYERVLRFAKKGATLAAGEGKMLTDRIAELEVKLEAAMTAGEDLVAELRRRPHYYRDVRSFNVATSGDEHAKDTPQLRPDEIADLRVRLIDEEVDELNEAIVGRDLVGIADALGDILYVTFGAFAAYGIDPAPVHAEIQRSNMAKLVDGKCVRREDGKILKPEGWTPPDLAAVLRAQGANV